MQDYVYPKVPNHYHDTVTDEFFNATDLVMVEKLDGSNCKIVVYDDRYRDLYGEDIHEYDPEHGDVFISSKKVVRGRLSDPLDTVDDAFARIFATLRDRFSKVGVLELHDTYDSPLVLFGEHMLRHTLDYGYGEDPPPAFIGFDVLAMAEHETPPEYPFDERFGTFLELEDAYDVLRAGGVETAPIVDRLDPGVDPDSLHIPMSEYANVEAEGVVLRSDSQDRRVKHVTAEFRERAQEAWGLSESDAESGAELFSARYLTNARLRKTVNKLLYSHDTDEITASVVAQAAVADAWEEELIDIRSIGIPVVPADIFPEAETRSQAVIETMQSNAALNDTTLDKLWQEFHDADETGGVTSFSVSTGMLSTVISVVDETDDVETGLVHEHIPEQRIHETVERIAAEDDREIGRWTVTEACDELGDSFWYENMAVLANLPVAFVPGKISDVLIEYITIVVGERDDVVIDEKPEDWRLSIDEAETSGLSELF